MYLLPEEFFSFFSDKCVSGKTSNNATAVALGSCEYAYGIVFSNLFYSFVLSFIFSFSNPYFPFTLNSNFFLSTIVDCTEMSSRMSPIANIYNERLSLRPCFTRRNFPRRADFSFFLQAVNHN